MTTYQYVSVMQAKNDTEPVPEGKVIFMHGKKPESHIEKYFSGEGDDAEIVGVGFRRLDLIELPERMSKTGINSWIDSRSDELAGEYANV